jgi:hypothetical protein
MRWIRFAALAFVLHLSWEMAQMSFYRGVADGAWWASVPSCSRAALFDAAVSLAIVASFRPVLKRRPSGPWLWVGMMVVGAALAIAIEKIGIQRGRWAYAEGMPLVPWFRVGLLPTLQMMLIPWVSLWVSAKNQDSDVGGRRMPKPSPPRRAACHSGE